MRQDELIGIIGLFFSFLFILAVSGWLHYSFYLKYEGKEKKKQL